MLNENQINDNITIIIKEEYDNLNKLLYRNKNQHGKTKIYSYLKGVKNFFFIFIFLFYFFFFL